MYVINLETKKIIKIGRSHDSDIRVTDISVSRFHALIRVEKDGSFLLEDNHSKFGTLVLMQSPKLRILLNNPLTIQIGRTFFCFSVKKPFSLFSCICNSDEKMDKKLDYQIMNREHISFEKSNHIKIQNLDETLSDM